MWELFFVHSTTIKCILCILPVGMALLSLLYLLCISALSFLGTINIIDMFLYEWAVLIYEGDNSIVRSLLCIL